MANTMIGAVRFGNSSLTMIRKFEAPSDRAASTNSFSRNDKHLAPDDPGRIGPARQRDHRDHDRDARLDQAAQAPGPERAGRGQADGQQQVRNGQPRVDRARDHRVDPAAVVAGEQPTEDPEHGRDRRSRRPPRPATPGRRRACAAEHVAADLVDAEQVGRARPGRLTEDVQRALVGRVRPRRAHQRADQRREDRARISRIRKTMPASANLSSRKRRKNSSHGDRAAISPLPTRSPPPTSTSSRSRSGVPTLMG